MGFHLINQVVIMEEDYGWLQVNRKDLNQYYLHFQSQVVKIEILDYLLQLVDQMGLGFHLVYQVVIKEEDFGELLVDRKDLNQYFLHFQRQNQNLLDLLLPQVVNQMG